MAIPVSPILKVMKIIPITGLPGPIIMFIVLKATILLVARRPSKDSEYLYRKRPQNDSKPSANRKSILNALEISKNLGSIKHAAPPNNANAIQARLRPLLAVKAASQ